jgi:hypothetical protein
VPDLLLVQVENLHPLQAGRQAAGIESGRRFFNLRIPGAGFAACAG